MKEYDFAVIENFQHWNDWYADNKIRTNKLSTKFYPNQGVVLKKDGAKAHGIAKGDYIENLQKYYPRDIKPMNSEQEVALGLLKDNTIPLKIISGVAGSGKTLLSCAHALEQLDNGKTSKIVLAKSLTPVGREVGYLKGSLEDKIRPFMGAFYDNFIVCGVPFYTIDDMAGKDQLEVVAITFLQGRSIRNATIIVDEAQNLDIKILKQIITRVGEGSELILLGDPTQNFEKSVHENTLQTLIELGRNSSLVGHVSLRKSLRSELAEWAVRVL